MKAAFYAGATGLIAQQVAMDAIGNNVANASTTGYKSEEVAFRNLLYNQMYANTATDPLTGYGVRALSMGINYTAGNLQQTGQPLDFAVEGNGMFAVQQGGQTLYTRDGTFAVSVEGGTQYLVTADGAYVLNKAMQHIAVTYDAQNRVDIEAIRDQLGLFSFRDPTGLAPQSGNRYLPNDVSGPAQAAGAGNKVLSGFLERSNVSAADEMSDMIVAQRAYQMSAKVLQTADEDEQTINSLRK